MKRINDVLDLTGKLGEMGLNDISSAIESNKEEWAKLDTLDMSDNLLHEFSAKSFITLIKLLPENLTSLNLSDNFLGFFKQRELIEIFEALSKTLTNLKYINLSSNFLAELDESNKKKGTLGSVINKLPKSITSVDLSHNKLSRVFYPNLDKSDNKEDTTSDDNRVILRIKSDNNTIKLYNLIESFPNNVTSIKFNGNDLSVKDVSLLFKKMSRKIKSIDLSGNELEKMSIHTQVKLFCAMPESLTSVKINDLRLEGESCKLHKYKLLTDIVEREIKRLTGSTGGVLGALGIVQSSQSKIEALRKLEKILNVDKDIENTDLAGIKQALKDWKIDNYEIIQMQRNKVHGFFSSHTSRTESMVNDVFNLLDINEKRPVVNKKY